MCKNNEKVSVICSVFSIFIMGLIFFCICRYRPWIGDDSLHCFSGGLLYYIHPEYSNTDMYLGDYFSNISQVIEHAKLYYFNWGGRLLTGFVDPLMVISGKTFSAFITTLIYICIIILGLNLAVTDIKEIFLHPLILLILGGIMLFYNRAMDLLLMRCMMDLYGFSFFLYLALFNIYRAIVEKKIEIKNSIVFYISINVIGFLAGISHELIGAWFIFQLLFYSFLKIKDRKIIIHNIKYFIGLICGYIICILAPGNFARTQQKHESGLNTSLLIRLYKSIAEHFNMLCLHEDGGKVLFISLVFISLLCVIFLVINKKLTHWEWYIEMFAYILSSVVLWGFVAKTVSRGLYVALLYFILIFIKVIIEAEKQVFNIFFNKLIIFLFLSLMLFVLFDLSWIGIMIPQAKNREALISHAAEAEQPVAKVEVFSEECNHYIFCLDIVDSQEELDWFYSDKMYGTHVELIK